MTSINVETSVIDAFKDAYLNENYLIHPPYDIYRVDARGIRFYVQVLNNKIKTAPGVTGILSKVMPTEVGLIKWRCSLGWAESQKFFYTAADYGTYIHMKLADIMREGKFTSDNDWFLQDMDATAMHMEWNQQRLQDWVEEEGRSPVKDILGFVKWYQDWKVIPIAIEFPVFHPKYSGTIDLVCKLTNPKNGTEQIAIVDFKTGKSFYESHEIQLFAYQQAWNRLYPELKATRMFNWAPSDYKIPPGPRTAFYKFKDQTDSSSQYKWPLYLKLFHGDAKNTEIKKYSHFMDTECDITTDLTKIIEVHDPLGFVKEIVQKNKKKKEAKK